MYFFLPVPPCCLSGNWAITRFQAITWILLLSSEWGALLCIVLSVWAFLYTHSILWTVLRSLHHPCCHLYAQEGQLPKADIPFSTSLYLFSVFPLSGSSVSHSILRCPGWNLKVTYPPLTHFPQIFFLLKSPISSSIHRRKASPYLMCRNVWVDFQHARRNKLHKYNRVPEAKALCFHFVLKVQSKGNGRSEESCVYGWDSQELGFP